MRSAILLALLITGAPLLAADPQPAAAKPEPDKDKLICRRETPVGSLIATRKVCLTKSAWDRRETDGNEIARQYVYDNTSKQSGN